MTILKKPLLVSGFFVGGRDLLRPFLFLSRDEDVIFEGHDLAAAEEGLFDEGQRPVFEPFVFVYF